MRTISKAEIGLVDYTDHVERLSLRHIALDTLNAFIHGDAFWPSLQKTYALRTVDRGGHPVFDMIFMWTFLFLSLFHHG
jgi:hypothetical protein